jgi:predicted lipoprotein with Yx(FWY)xxD motif
MYRRLTALAAGLSMLALAACGSDGDSTSEAAGTPTDAAPAASTAGASGVVTVAAIEGFGDVLVDAEGMPLYTADEEAEADGQALCVDSCTSFWVPLEPGDGAPPEVPGIGELDVAERPDGAMQVTADGRLLYTFAQDSPGDVTGDGFADDFGDEHLTWHVVRVGEAAAAPATPGVTSEEPSSNPADGGLYDYGG